MKAGKPRRTQISFSGIFCLLVWLQLVWTLVPVSVVPVSVAPVSGDTGFKPFVLIPSRQKTFQLSA
jgi:hypothetical protein